MKSSIIKKFFNLFFPRVCAVCGEELLEEETGLCLQCLYRLPKTNNFDIKDNSAEKLLAGRIPFDRIATFCVYSDGGTLQPLIHHLKYRNKKEIGLMLGRLFANDLLNSDLLKPIDFIVPVPLHPKKEKQRGYNQVEFIAKGLSEVTGLPVSTGILVRKMHNPTQTKRTKTERWLNVQGIFDVTNSEIYHDKHILLVDDIMTTGSTVEACGVALQKCKSIKISIATIGEVY